MYNIARTPNKLLTLALALTLLMCVIPQTAVFAYANTANSTGECAEPDDGKIKPSVFVQGEVFALADSPEHALEIAAAYDLELKSYSYGIAIFNSADPQETVAFSRTLSLSPNIPKLGLNYTHTVRSSGDAEQETDNEADELRMWHHKELDVERAWQLSTGKGVIVAVVDTGIDIDNPEFSGRILPNSYNSYTDQIGLEYVRDDYLHGTHVTGIVAAARDDGNDVSGVAPDADILVIKANTPEDPSEIDEATMLRGINYAVENGADIINMSFILNEYLSPEEQKKALEQSSPIFANAAAKGVTLISVTSNESNNWVEYPGSHPDVIAVSATEAGSIFAYSLSNYGPETELSAPGVMIYSYVLDGECLPLSGTSQAAPNVAGVAALVKSIHPEYTPSQIREVLNGTARDGGPLGFDERYGHGIVNAYAAVLGIGALHDITYDFNDGSSTLVTVKAAHGAKLIEPYFPQRSGYAFDGWYTTPSAGHLFDFSAGITKDTTIYAKWVKPSPGTYAEVFPDVNFYREVLRMLNLNDNGKRTPASVISAADFEAIAAISEFSLSSREMESLVGLDHFKGLSTLNVRKNRIKELDMSKFTSLTMLVCDFNRLSTLNVSNNPALEYLLCNDNRLDRLDISKNPVLDTLMCHNNQISALNISNNPALTTLMCYDNQLSTLDVSNNPGLAMLICYSNRLNALDVSKNSALNTLVCYDNRLSSLDISNNADLTVLHCQKNTMRFLSDVTGWQTNSDFTPGSTFKFYPQTYDAWYDDVNKDDWFYDCVKFISEYGLMSGVNDNLFDPTGTVSRAVTASVLWKLENEPSSPSSGFTDVPADKWYADAVSWAAANGIVSGYGDGTFTPDNPITFEQLTVMLYRYAVFKEYETESDNLPGSAGSGAVSYWAREAMTWAFAQGITSDIGDGKIDSKGAMSRANFAAIIHVFAKDRLE